MRHFAKETLTLKTGQHVPHEIAVKHENLKTRNCSDENSLQTVRELYSEL
jgi:hypothetical protein